jgi:hypothetical protein
MSDNWIKVPGSTFCCGTCDHYINYRCRRHAPKGQEGWPAVFPTDWCGDHKMNKQTMNFIHQHSHQEAKKPEEPHAGVGKGMKK